MVYIAAHQTSIVRRSTVVKDVTTIPTSVILYTFLALEGGTGAFPLAYWLATADFLSATRTGIAFKNEKRLTKNTCKHFTMPFPAPHPYS